MSQIVGATHPGNRDHNEDCFVADAALGLGLVADGMGGYACGEVASELVKKTVTEAIANSEGLRDAIVRAHAVVCREATSDEAKKGMGSTVIAFRIQDQEYELAWVGDSRAYLWDGETRTLHQITRDHSYVETLLSSGAISHDEAINHPNRNLITQAIGVAGGDGLEIELISGRLGNQQQLMICSDGLVDEVVDEDIADILSQSSSPEEAVRQLIERALINGGRDNVTVVITAGGEAGHSAVEPDIVRSTNAAGSSSDSSSGSSTPGANALSSGGLVGAASGWLQKLLSLVQGLRSSPVGIAVERHLSSAAARLSDRGINPRLVGYGLLALVIIILVYL